MAGLSITGQMKVSTLQEGFLKEFGLTLRVYDGREFADPSQTLGQVRKKKGSGKALSVAKNMKVGNLEDKFEEEFGLKVQVAGSDDSYLCDNNLTLNAAQQEDEKKLARKERKAERQAEASDDEEDEVDDDWYCLHAPKEDLVKLLELLMQHSSETSRKYLEYNVEETGEDGLVVGAATTWMQFSNEQTDKIAYLLEDEDGIFELEAFELTDEGLGECLISLFNQQQQVKEATFNDAVQQLITTLNNESG